MTAEQKLKAEKIIELHKKKGSLIWDTLYFDEDNSVFETEINQGEQYKELEIIKSALIELQLINCIGERISDLTRLTAKGFLFETFTKPKEIKPSDAPNIITSVLKDSVLKYLVSNCNVESLSTGKTAETFKDLDINFETFNAIMTQFQRLGLIEDLNLRISAVQFILRTEAHDLFLRGGFLMQEEVIENNVNKLLLEIDHLKKELGPNHLESVSKISTIASAILTGMGIMRNGN